ncbi:MAG: DUF1592 domain-containing protein [Myxococcota bacterium]
MRRRAHSIRAGLAWITIAVAGCYTGLSEGGSAQDDGGTVGGGSEGSEGEQEPQEPGEEVGQCGDALEIGGSQIRRMTTNEYNRTVSALLGISTTVADMFPPDSRARGFDNQAEVQEVSPSEIKAWQDAAETLSAEAMADMVDFVGCDVAGEDGDACVASFLVDFGLRAFRRPLSDDELDKYTSFYEQHRSESGPERALQMLVQSMLMSPNFLYLVELGQEGEVTALDDYAIASRLSYLLWNSMPDQELFAAAEAGALSTPEGIEEQARRMLADPQARDVVRDFYMQWTDAHALGSMQIPEGFEPSLSTSAEEGLSRFVMDWHDQGGRMPQLLTSTKAFLNEELAAYYGVEGIAGSELVEASLDPQTHGGVLTRAAVVGTHGLPPNRGDFVLGKLLCNPLTVPALEIPEPPEGEEFETRRQSFEAHAELECARACHQILDPLGFAFEHYDESGMWRATDNGHPIDATTEIGISSFPELEGPIDGAMELSERLANSETVLRCHAETWFTYAYGRPSTKADGCSEQQLADAFVATEGDMEQLLVDLTLTDAFRYVRKQALEP